MLDSSTGKPVDFDSGMCDMGYWLREEKIIVTVNAACENLLRRSIRTRAL